MTVQLLPMLELDIGDINMSSSDFYQALISCDILGRLHTSGAAVLGPVVIHMPGPGAPGFVTWIQPKSGCVAYAKMLTPALGVIPVSTMALPPPPTDKSVTFESEGVCLNEEPKKPLRALETERDA